MNLFLEKRKSNIHGIGVFTKRPISSGEVFYIIPLSKTLSEPKDRIAYIGDNTYVDDDEVLNWVNHSCDPNSDLNISEAPPALVAKRNISKGEEITVDYNKTEIRGIKTKCFCGLKNCKGEFNKF
ncbi:MAG: SET domain-containing protein-lysine N-methyltransferase [Patescibacteria group bacterium]|nr:SET domain-containing protein-lysine N-methyltransferase [Patescibacteria group bacterium]